MSEIDDIIARNKKRDEDMKTAKECAKVINDLFNDTFAYFPALKEIDNPLMADDVIQKGGFDESR